MTPLRKLSVLLVIFLLFSTTVSASDLIKTSGLDLSMGYRVDQLDWNIAGNNSGTTPNVLSELTWSDLEIFQLQLDGWAETRDLLWLKTNTLLVGKLAYGRIYSGDNQDSDYDGDNRSLEWSRSNNQSDKGFTLDASGGFGPKYKLLAGRLSIAPLLGYSFHMQDLSMTDGVQTVADTGHSPAPLSIGPIPGLDSSYTAYWWGPWLGLNLQLAPVEKLSLELTGEYHIVEYFAEANWNLRPDLAHPISFEHEAHGTGLVLTLKSAYELNQRWSVVFSGNVQYWQTGDGQDTTYDADGTRGGTRLNEVNWESYALMFGLRYRF